MMKMPAHLLRAAMLQRLSHREPDMDQRGGPSDNDGDNIAKVMPGMQRGTNAMPAALVAQLLRPMRKV